MPDEPLLSLKDYLDAQVAEVRRAVEIAKDVPPPEAVPLREHIEAVLDEQRRAMSTAEEEREKAAKALRSEMVRTIEEGDKNLREHIEQQVMQIRAALVSADLLEVERIDSLKQRVIMLNESATASIAARIDSVERMAAQHVEQLRHERQLVTAAQQEAIAKSEAASDRRFESVNEFRAQLSDQTATFMPREVAEAQFADLRRAFTELSEKMSKVV